MNHPEKSGSKLFPGDRGHMAVNVSSIDVSVELFLKASLFAKLNDDGVYAKKIQSEMTDSLENMKNILADTPGKDINLVAQYLADAYAQAHRFVLSPESREYLAVFSENDFEEVAKKILEEVRKCLSLTANLLGAEEAFNAYLTHEENSSSIQKRKDTIPYGVREIDDPSKPTANAPFLAYEPDSGSRRHFVRSTTQDFPAINLAEEVRKASLEADKLSAHISVPVSTPPPSRNTLPPPPMSGPAPSSKLEALDTSAETKKYFKKRFLDVYKSEFLKKLRDIASAKSDAKGQNKDGKIFEEAFDYICRKTYLQITSDVTGNAAVLALHDMVEQKVAEGAEWKSVIRKLGEDAIANKAQEVMRIYVPIITGAYLSNDKYREKIVNIQEDNDEDLRTKQEDAANCVLDYIRENMFKTSTSSKLDALVYLGYFFRETRSDLGLIFYEELYEAAGNIFAKIRQKNTAEREPEISVAEKQDEIQEEEEMPITLRGTGIDPIPYTVQLEIEKPVEEPTDEPSILVEGKKPPYVQGVLQKGDDEDDTDIFTLGDTRILYPKVTPAAGRPVVKPIVPKASPVEPVISYREEAPTIPSAMKVEEKPHEEIAVKEEETPIKKRGMWNRFKNSKAGKVATGAAFAVATVMAGYAGGVFSNTQKQESTDTTQATASATVSSNAGSSAFLQSAGISTGDAVDATKTSPEQNVEEPVQNTEPSNVYTIHLEKIAGDDTRLKNLVEKESFEREPGNRGDFEQLHSIVAQGALTAAQQNKLHEDLNGKYNRGEYGAATKRFRPLLENGEIFKVLGNANHPEHGALKAAVGKFGNPSYWSWSRKKPVLENGKVQIKSVHYEELHGEDVEFFEQCQKDFENLGIGKNGNVHLRNGEAGERIPLKINGKWITFVETALQIRGVIEARGAQDIPAPPASIMNDATGPAETIPTNVAPVDMEIDLQPSGHGKEGFLHLDTPEIEMGEPVMMAMSDLEDNPEIEIGEEVEVDLSDLEDNPEIEVGETVELAMSDLEDDPEIEIGETEMDDDTLLALVDDGWGAEEADSPTIEVHETEMDDETLLALVDDEWDSEEIEKSIQKTLQKVKLAA